MRGAPFIADDAELVTDLPAYNPLHQAPNNIPHRDDSTLAVGMLGPIHSQASNREVSRDHG